MKPRIHASRSQSGSALLEGLIAILIFSVGILAIVGMEATAVQNSGDAKYRTDAALVANQLIGQMWVDDRTGATLKTNFETGGAKYALWVPAVTGTPGPPPVPGLLPGAADKPPTVTVNATTGQVTIVIFWKAPSDPAAAPYHSHTVMARIK
jgi:type IV pilus assembly protein PilV